MGGGSEFGPGAEGAFGQFAGGFGLERKLRFDRAPLLLPDGVRTVGGQERLQVLGSFAGRAAGLRGLLFHAAELAAGPGEFVVGLFAGPDEAGGGVERLPGIVDAGGSGGFGFKSGDPAPVGGLDAGGDIEHFGLQFPVGGLPVQAADAESGAEGVVPADAPERNRQGGAPDGSVVRIERGEGVGGGDGSG